MWSDVEDRLIKANRKYIPINSRSAELFCVECETSLGIHDMVYFSHESYKYCDKCVKKFAKEVPRCLSDNITVLFDNGNFVTIRYENIRQEHDKTCYFNSKGRFIKVKNKRYYV
jgi:hypothetical protein